MLSRSDSGDGVVVLTIDHPPANALTNEIIASLANHLTELAGQPDSPGVVLTGAGERFFCPGGDIKELNGEPIEFAVERMRLFHELVVALERFPRPLVCAVAGYCVGEASSWRSFPMR